MRKKCLCKSLRVLEKVPISCFQLLHSYMYPSDMLGQSEKNHEYNNTDSLFETFGKLFVEFSSGWHLPLQPVYMKLCSPLLLCVAFDKKSPNNILLLLQKCGSSVCLPNITLKCLLELDKQFSLAFQLLTSV